MGSSTRILLFLTFLISMKTLPVKLKVANCEKQALQTARKMVTWSTLPTNPWNRHGYKLMAVDFANIFMAEVETDILSQSALKPLVGKRYVDDIFSL